MTGLTAGQQLKAKDGAAWEEKEFCSLKFVRESKHVTFNEISKLPHSAIGRVRRQFYSRSDVRSDHSSVDMKDG